MKKKRVLSTELCAELRLLYEDHELGIVAIGARLGCSGSTVANWLRECGITLRSGQFKRRAVSGHLLRQLYSVERLPIREIAARLGISVSGVNSWRRALGIPTRPRRATYETPLPNSRSRRGRLAENSLHFAWS
jgi:hypothetical protein